MLCAWGARLGDNSLAYIYESFVIVYATQQLHMTRDVIVTALMFSTAAQLVTVPLFGWLSDQIGRRPVYMLGAVLSGVAVFPFFKMLDRKPGHAVRHAFMVSSVARP
jgi:MFS family permease